MHEHLSPRQAVAAMIRDNDLEGLLLHAETIHGHRCPLLALGVKAGRYAMNYLEQEGAGSEEVLAVVECNNGFADGIQVVCGCTFGNQGLTFKDLGKTAVTVARRRDGAAVRLALRPDFREAMFARYPVVEPLFDRVVAQGRSTAEERHRFQHLWQAVARRELLEVPLEDQFGIQPLKIEVFQGGAGVSPAHCGAGLLVRLTGGGAG
jgi:formylmethanofuran dehydrogenase subunit E